MQIKAEIRSKTKIRGSVLVSLREAMNKLCTMRFQKFNTAGQAGKIKKVISVADMAKRYTKVKVGAEVCFR